MNKTKVQEELKWMGEETNLVEMVNQFCWQFLFLNSSSSRMDGRKFCRIRRTAYIHFEYTI